MMKKTLLLIILIVASPLLFATIIEVKQDGTGDYTIIQDGTDAAVSGDTILVYPGIYYENINLHYNNITLASLSLTTGNNSYRLNTIIDGSQNESCIIVHASFIGIRIHGFTVRNGSGTNVGQHFNWTSGGGISLCNNVNSSIENCIIRDNNCNFYGAGVYSGNYSVCNVVDCIFTNNIAEKAGGGILISGWASLTLSGTSFYNNHSYGTGGGVAISYEATCVFDSINLCSIYKNYSQWGNDVHKASAYDVDLYVDTLTVMQPDTYFLSSIGPEGYQNYGISYNIQNAYLTPVDADLYVNPITGSNQNSGLSPNEPLKTIAYAYTKIAVDSVKRNTIYLANGHYSDSTNGEKFPLNIRPFINVQGESMIGTVLDGNYKSKILKGNNDISNYTFSKMTIQRGSQIADYDDFIRSDHGLALLYWQKDIVTFDSVLFQYAKSLAGRRTVTIGSHETDGESLKMVFSNCSFKDNLGSTTLSIGGNNHLDTCRITNCIFTGMMFDTLHPEPQSRTADALLIGGSGGSTAIITNTLFSNNNKNAFVGVFANLFGSYTQQNYLINCTFTNNGKFSNNTTIWMDGSDNKFYNCIVYDEGNEILLSLSNNQHIIGSNLEIYNSLIENGEDAVSIAHNDCEFWYDHITNIDEDPIFTGIGENPYQIDYGSPCIDAGTLDLPSFITIPEFDLAGNPRVVGNTIDMGAYEWNPTVGVSEYQAIATQIEKLINVAPNPFTDNTKITVTAPVDSNVKLEVYNNYGQRVNVIIDGLSLTGTLVVNWQGKDKQNRVLPKGIYYIVLVINNKEADEVTVIKQ